MKTKNTSDRAKCAGRDPHDWKRILVPLDFSDSSVEALHYAIPLAHQSGGKLLLLHVVQLPILPTPAVTGGALGQVKEAHKALTEHAKAQLDKLVKESGTAGVVTHKIVTVGLASDEIIKAAKRLKSDLVVMSIHARGGLQRLLSSRTAEHVVRQATCPVLCVQG